jgi:hypothetical protein
VLKQLIDSGDAFLGPALVKGRTGLRACFMNLRTTEADVDFIVARLKASAESIRSYGVVGAEAAEASSSRRALR